jgi:hypothetical protein
MSGASACPACGHAASARTHFCTRCGAVLPPPARVVPPAPPPEPPPPPAARVAQAPPADPPPSRWALDTPPANESWWRNPIVLAAAIATVLLGGGVASWRFFIASNETVSAVHALPQQQRQQESLSSATPPTEAPADTTDPPAPPASEPDEATVVAEVTAIVRRSAEGRAALRRLDYAAALTNRRSLVAEIDRLDVPEEPAGLAHAVVTLRAALAASARADRAHIACGCHERLPEDVTAHALKHAFAAEFDPYARRHLGHPIDPERI